MSGLVKKIKVNDLLNYYENPRHAVASSEVDTLTKLYSAVGIQPMLNLAEDILDKGLLGNQQIVVVYSQTHNRYVVYEGNRRVAVLKLLKNPDAFAFLGKDVVDKVKRMVRGKKVLGAINCYVTDESEAFFIMERLHSGEDLGRGVKQWTSREKEAFKARQTNKRGLSFLIDLYIRSYFSGFDITTILSFTTIQRIFNNREVRKQIGLDVQDESTFTRERMQLVIDAARWVNNLAISSGVSTTRLFNKSRTIEDKLLPWISSYSKANSMENQSQKASSDKADNATNPFFEHPAEDKKEDTESPQNLNGEKDKTNQSSEPNQPPSSDNSDEEASPNSKPKSGGARPYFFQGLNFKDLDPNDNCAHGLIAVCREIQLFSDKKLVDKYPIASTFLVRSLIEQTIIYYSKKHTIGQNKFIWDHIKDQYQLSGKISKYKKNLNNYISDDNMRKYFMDLFGDYSGNIDPLNWVIHRPAEYQLGADRLIELPRKGLLTLINFMIQNPG